jgi:hypothetical protein
MAQRYGLLPSECLSRATTFDLEMMDIAKSWERYRHNKANGVLPDIKEDVMLEAIKQVK